MPANRVVGAFLIFQESGSRLRLHTPHGCEPLTGNLEQAQHLLAYHHGNGVVTTFSSFRSSDLSQSI